MNVLSEYQTERLLLLIGTNPLPNYVAAKLLLKSGGLVCLVCSSDTYLIAERLHRSLDSTQVEYLQVKDGDGDDVFRVVSKWASGKHGVGLNYTGGTKIMGVHSFRAIERADPDAVFSYLDANAMQMVVGRADGPALRCPTKGQVPIDLRTLLAMHGYEVRDRLTEPVFPREAEELAHGDCRRLRDECDANLRDEKGLKKKAATPVEGITLPAAWGGFKTLGEIASALGSNSERVAKWLDGKWLEDYVLLTIQRIAEQCQISDSAAGIEPKASVGSTDREFEFDVAAMIGYQLFAIACTTSTRRGLIKEKLMVAHVRARQMGGDEARVAVACLASEKDPDPKKTPAGIQDEVQEVWDAKNKIRVFGIEDIKTRMAERLSDWFLNQP